MIQEDRTIKSYAGFTIGPIYEVLLSARKTRELWFASYFFSWFMEKIIETLSSNSSIEFIMPYVDVHFKTNNSITGKYSDRFILQSYLNKKDLFNKIQFATNNTLDFFVELIDKLVQDEKLKYINNANKNTVRDFLNNYVQRNFVVFDANDFNLTKEVQFPKIVKSINKYLYSMEKNRYFDTGILNNTCFICRALPAYISAKILIKTGSTRTGVASSSNLIEKELCPLCFAKYYALKNSTVKEKIKKSNFRYPTVLDIAAVELLTYEMKDNNPTLKDPKEEYDFKDIEQALYNSYSKEMVDSLLKKSYVKYFAIIQADGDNLGKIIEESDDISKLSKSLFDFANKAEKIVYSYKGLPIYIGGDDILALVPVAFKEKNGDVKTVIDLAIELSEGYRNLMNKNLLGTSLSFGINIAYYKFPLSISLKNARKQLFEEAKKDNKNALALLLTKHSGHQIGFKFKFDSPDINNFNSILRMTIKSDYNFLYSIHHNLSRFKTILANIPDEDRLKAFFENNFNEPEHVKYSSHLDLVMNYFKEVMLPVPNQQRLNYVEEIISKLEFIKFLRGEK